MVLNPEEILLITCEISDWIEEPSSVIAFTIELDSVDNRLWIVLVREVICNVSEERASLTLVVRDVNPLYT